MSLTIHPKTKHEEGDMSKLIAPERIYRTAAGDICEESDPRVAFVVVNVGHEIPAEYVAKWKAYVAERDGVAEPEPEVPAEHEHEHEPEPDTKKVEPADNKKASRASDK